MLNSLLLLSSILIQTYGQAFGFLTGNIADALCTDKMTNCISFDQGACQDPYTAWAMENCRHFCGFCQVNKPPTAATTSTAATTQSATTASHVIGPITSALPCVDTRTDCDIFGKSVCTDQKYIAWANKSCRLYCRLCPANMLPPITTISPALCVDKHDDCKQYGKASCHGAYYSWANDNCRQYCGFCDGPTTVEPPCRNKIQSCYRYPGEICTSDKYKDWAEENCNQHCGFCSGGSTAGTPSGTTAANYPVIGRKRSISLKRSNVHEFENRK
ncbi:Hypothetical predicted protein [Mytilus galloprovincialis]|uniref:ShKT domain-containing protein n=1 Tax=Mytilus galloprovincialis TaxID=29158 RepID=A0A8B6D8I9_MYTGA|nr:Hypothetical predicted protein [Mytilus galloprovincialis]